jgi:hypothetical protein
MKRRGLVAVCEALRRRGAWARGCAYVNGGPVGDSGERLHEDEV